MVDMNFRNNSPNPIWISPSILAADFANLGEEVRNVLKAGADRIHIDVMDHQYVPNLSFGPVVLASLQKAGIQAPFDVHLMVTEVLPLAQSFADLSVDFIYFHPDAVRHLDRAIHQIKAMGVQVGLVLNPADTLESLEYVLPLLDRVMLMSVNPGFSGQSFIPYVVEKVSGLRSRLNQLHHPIRIEVDGGVTLENIKPLVKAGADTFVMGSALFGQDSLQYEKYIQEVKKMCHA